MLMTVKSSVKPEKKPDNTENKKEIAELKKKMHDEENEKNKLKK